MKTHAATADSATLRKPALTPLTKVVARSGGLPARISVAGEDSHALRRGEVQQEPRATHRRAEWRPASYAKQKARRSRFGTRDLDRRQFFIFLIGIARTAGVTTLKCA